MRICRLKKVFYLTVVILIFGIMCLMQTDHFKEISYLNKLRTQFVPDDSDAMSNQKLADSLSHRQHSILIKMKKHLSTAHRYARSGITRNEISTVYSMLSELIQDKEKEIDSTIDLHSLRTSTQLDVCPEKRAESKWIDHPLYNQVIKIAECDRKSFHTVLSFVSITRDCSLARSIIQGVYHQYGKIEMQIGVVQRGDCDLSELKEFSSHSIFLSTGIANNGRNWMNLIEKTTAKYILVGRNLYSFNNQSNVERMIRILSITGVDAVGGAERYEDGRWFTGCYQMALKNYTLRLVEGYDMSYNSCIYCDYLSSSFVSLKNTLLSKLSSELTENAVFVDYFLKLFKENRIGAMDCPDVLFSSISSEISSEARSMWQEVATEWQINRIILPNHRDIRFSCEETNTKCIKTGGILLPICCLQELADALKFLMSSCRNSSIDCMIVAGTVVGAIKSHGVLPWERDEDTVFRASHYNKFEQLIPWFKTNGYELRVEYTEKFKTDVSKCIASGTVDCLYYGMHSKNWRIEMFGINWMISDRRGDYRVPTKQMFDGMWMDSYTNPALNMRNLYGDDIFQHVEHWMDLNQKHSHTNYTFIKKGKFLPCPVPNFHGCLSNYLPEGNIQFKDIWI